MSILSATLYHSGLSQDVEKLVASLIAGDGLRARGLVGLLHGWQPGAARHGTLGQQAPPQLVAAAMVSPACDLCDQLRPHPRARIWNLRVVVHALVCAASYRRKAELARAVMIVNLLRGVHRVRSFDENITARYMGFAGAEDYYDKASTSHVLDRIALPTLVIHAEDDPFIMLSARHTAQAGENPEVQFLHDRTRRSLCLHLRARNGDDGRWAERKVIEFLSKVEEGRA